MSQNFQSESKKTGIEFETLVENHLISLGYTVTSKQFKFSDIGIDVDFVATNGAFTEYIEAKGGKSGVKKRPGAQRTDNVKKAIANGALLKSHDPTLYFVVYFSAPPPEGKSADKMIRTAMKYKFIDEVRYILI
jgi:hypothetical protein